MAAPRWDMKYEKKVRPARPQEATTSLPGHGPSPPPSDTASQHYPTNQPWERRKSERASPDVLRLPACLWWWGCHQVIAEFCAGFREDDTVDLFLPSVTRCLRERDPVAYSEHLPGINRQKLHRRLWAGLKREACKYHEAGALRQAILREKGIKVRGRRQAGTN